MTAEDDPPEPPRRRIASGLGLAAAVALPTAVLVVHAARYGSWIIDDAGITFAYARSIADGHGIVQQPGADTVEGYSNPLWVLLHVVGHWLGLFDRGTILGTPDYVVFPKALGVGCFLGILAATHAAARAVVRPAWLVTVVVGLVLAANPSFVVWTVSGLENPLYGLAAALLAALLICATVNDWLLTPPAAVAASLIALMAALTRPDGLMLAVAYPALAVLLVRKDTWRDGLRSVTVALLGFAVPYGLFLVWRSRVFGRLVPNTAVAKSQDVPDLSDFGKVRDLLTYPGRWTVVFGAVVVAFAAARWPPMRRVALAAGVPLALTLLAYGGLENDWMGEARFATPVWVLGSMLVGLAFVQVLVEAGPWIRVGLAAGTVGAVVVSSTVLLDHQATFRQAPTVPLCLVADRFGRFYNELADRLGVEDGEGSILLPDIGGTLLTSGLTVYDLAGLTDATIADAYDQDDIQQVRNYVFGEIKPTFIHSHGNWRILGGIEDPRLNRDYMP
ncbi:MAG TPA: hypothetical protein VGJ86_10890, partial [Acidimicrobiales bacterium]